jgi:hypothetical protein
VINGAGGGLFEEGAVLQISARDPGADEQFAGWEGDVWFLDDMQSLTPTVTLPDYDITLTAVFNDTSSSSGLSSWADSYGLGEGQNSPTDCPAGDQVSNLEKYAIGWNPMQTYDPSDVFYTRKEAGRVVVGYQKYKWASDVNISVIWSTALTGPLWRTDQVETSLIGETATHQLWEISVPQPAASPLFIRLRFNAQ